MHILDRSSICCDAIIFGMSFRYIFANTDHKGQQVGFYLLITHYNALTTEIVNTYFIIIKSHIV